MLERLDFTKRFRVDIANDQIEETTEPPAPVLMQALWVTNDALRYKPLSNTGKIEAGMVANSYKRKLPSIPVAAAIIDAYHGVPVGTGPAQGFPYALKAVGPVNPYQIMNRTGTLVSKNVELVP